MMLKRLRRRMVLTTMAIVSVVLLLAFGLILYTTRTSLERESLSTMTEIAAQPGRLGPRQEDFQEALLPYFTVEITRNDELVARGGGNYDLTDADFLREVTDAALAGAEDSGILEEYQLRYLRWLDQGPPRVVFADITQERQTMRNLLRSCLLLGGGSFLAFLLLSILLARRAVRPVEEAWQQQRQFVGDASHELKTPLTVIMTNAELLQDENVSPAARRRFSDSILAMSTQMRGLVENLLELARVDSGVAEVKESVDLSALTEDALLPFEALFFEKGLELTAEIQPGIKVHGAPARLRQVVDVLLDNAQSYASAGGRVEVSLTRQGGSCRLTVANSGEPIPAAERENIFKRFYRGDAAHSMNRHYGLGLPIAQGIVENHKGRIWADSREGLNYFHVELPLHGRG
ncbi:MAG: HAMP domain-containing histidine kinase [Firmicutes bacterium]|nr:HAMP domain-containing histidine kinase [Bacillota bacterium]